MASTWQHEPLRTPGKWSGEEKRFAQQVNDIFDDIYAWRNRLRFEDFNTATRRRLVDTEQNVSSLEQTTKQLSLRVSNYDETKLWQAATEEELLQELEDAGVALTDGILWSDTTNLVIRRYNGSGWDTMQTDALKTSFITIENDSVSIGSGGKLSIIAGSSFTLEAGSGDNFVGMSTTRTDGYRIWAGHSDPALAPYSVKKTGELHASRGNIGGFSIRKNTEWFMEIFSQQEGLLEEFDEGLFFALADVITVYHDGRVVVRFRDGAEVEASTPSKARTA